MLSFKTLDAQSALKIRTESDLFFLCLFIVIVKCNLFLWTFAKKIPEIKDLS